MRNTFFLKKGGAQGFTLLEILVVIIIISVLASLAMPRYFRTIDYARAMEALAHLGSIRQSLFRYYAPNRTYAGAFLSPTSPWDTNLDIDNPNNESLYPGSHFAYTIDISDPPTSFTITARRNLHHGGDNVSTITLNDRGEKSGSVVYSGIQ